jgi:hypothetical protein
MAFQLPTFTEAKIGTNEALSHRNGTLDDNILLLETDQQLRARAYDIERTTWTGEIYGTKYENVVIERIVAVRTEWYRAPMRVTKAADQGHSAGEYYQGVCRAALLLDQRKEERIKESQQRKVEDKEAINSLQNYAPDSDR